MNISKNYFSSVPYSLKQESNKAKTSGHTICMVDPLKSSYEIINFVLDTCFGINNSEQYDSIWYTIDGSEPMHNNPQLYWYQEPITISRSMEIQCKAFRKNNKPLKCTIKARELQFESWINAQPVDSSFYKDSLKVVLFSNNKQIFVTTDGKTEPELGNVKHLYKGPFYVFGDSVIVWATTADYCKESVSKKWRYFRKKLHVVASEKGKFFTNPLQIYLYVYPRHPSAKIYYTLDGSTPSQTSYATKLYLSNAINLTNSTILKALIVAPDAIVLDTLCEKYLYLPKSETEQVY